MDNVKRIIERHRRSGRFINVEGINTFILRAGAGMPVVCLHGVPTSSFLYRKLIPSLAAAGMEGISFDFPGLGLSDRPHEFDYSFRGLLDFAERVLHHLDLPRFHLLVHDIGGPVGFALAGKMRERITGITVLNTWIDVKRFRKPLPVKPFSIPGLGSLALKMINRKTWALAFSLMGVSRPDRIPREEIYAYADLLTREDNGRAFLRIMQGYDRSDGFREMCMRGVRDVPYGIQAIWGDKDWGLSLRRYGTEIKNLVQPEAFYVVDSRHLVPEEHFEFITNIVGRRR